MSHAPTGEFLTETVSDLDPMACVRTIHNDLLDSCEVEDTAKKQQGEERQFVEEVRYLTEWLFLLAAGENDPAGFVSLDLLLELMFRWPAVLVVSPSQERDRVHGTLDLFNR
jgi:hypothetical protein